MLPAGACVVLAHPFRVGMTVMDPSLLFGIEAYNGGTDAPRNRLAADLAAAYGKPVTAGSDCHSIHGAAKGGIETPRSICTPQDLSAVLRSGDYRLYTAEKGAL